MSEYVTLCHAPGPISVQTKRAASASGQAYCSIVIMSSDSQTLYELLNVDARASIDEIRKSYKELALRPVKFPLLNS
jgi:hypothetical protein